MKRTRTVRAVAFCLLLAGLACSLPIPGTPPVTDVVPPPGTEPPPITEAPATEPPLVTEPPPAAEPLVVIHAEDEFRLHALDGTPSGTWSAAGLGWAREGTAQAVGDAVYYVDSGGASLGGVVRRVSASGAEELSFTAAEGLSELSFAVSPDESRIAWSHSAWDINGNTSELWVAAIDGSGATLVVQASPADELEDFYVLEPIAWAPDASLIYAWQVSGIGDLLFFGYSSLYRYAPASGTITPLAPIPPGGTVMPCWDGLSPDASTAIGSCASAGGVPGERERDLATGAEHIFPLWPDGQDQDGAGAYSPSGGQVAYAIAQGDFEHQTGNIIVAPHLGGDITMVASLDPGYFDRIFWVDEGRLVVGYWSGAASVVDVIRLSDLAQSTVGEGQLVGLLWP